MKGIAALSLAAVATASFSTETIHGDSAPVLGALDADHIPDSYIIKFKDHVDEASASDHHLWVQDVHESTQSEYLELRKRGSVDDLAAEVFSGLKHKYAIGDEFKGYAGHFHPDVIEQLRNHPDIEYIHRDTIVHTMLPLDNQENISEDSCDGELERQAPWGLARISHRDTLGFGTFNKYLYTEQAGEGVDAYVIDTGTFVDHIDFEGRAHWSKTIPVGDGDVDGNGHGTHCSGTIAGKKYGVAKKANVYAVKVLRANGSGSMSDVVAGVVHAVDSHEEQVKLAKDGKRKGFKGSVANMSLGGGKTPPLDAAVNAAVNAGIHFAVAAGNDNADACRSSPASASEPITVGASDLTDSRAYFSNFGKCTDIFGPGVSIQSTWIGSKYAVNTISGTSMASPHIAGLLAYYVSLQPATDSEFSVAPITPKQLKQHMLDISTKGALGDIPAQTPNLLAWNGGGCGNFTKIVEAGGYDAEAAPTTLEKELDMVSNKIVQTAETFGKKAEQLADKIHNLVDEELKQFLSSVTA